MSRKATFALFVPIVIVMIVVDRLTKVWAADNLSFGVTGPDFGVVDITLVHNFGAAFGMGQGNGWVFILITVAICALAIAWLIAGSKHHPLEVVGLALVVSGGIGNLIDRVTTEYVVDFLHFTFVDFPVFNVADICVTCGVVIFIIGFLFTGFFTEDESADPDLTSDGGDPSLRPSVTVQDDGEDAVSSLPTSSRAKREISASADEVAGEEDLK